MADADPRFGSGVDSKAAFELAHSYAWSWFSYHADQRLKTFNFFFLVVGALTAAYLVAIGGGRILIASALGALLFIVSIMFWRLDLRNSSIIKISESYLKESEQKLSVFVGDGIKIVSSADNPPDHLLIKPFPHILSSYRKIFRSVFMSVAFLSLTMIAYAVHTGAGWPAEFAP